MIRNATITTLFASLLLAGCAGRDAEPAPPPPPPIPLLAAIPQAPPSTLRVPIVVDLDFVAAKVLQELPKPLLQDTLRKQVQPIVLAPPLTVTVRHRSEMEALSLRLDGDQLTAVARVGFRVGGTVEGAGLAVGMASCGERPGEPTAAIEFTIAGKLGWGPDGTFTFVPRPWTLRWIRPCELTAIRVSLEDVLNLPGVRGRVQKAIDDAVRRLPEAVRVRPLAERTWRQASVPVPLAPGVFFSARPESLFVGPLRGDGRHLATSIVLLARPRVSADSTDSVKAMPPLREETASDQGFRIDLQGRLSLPRVDSLLSGLLRAQRLENDGKPVRIERARLYGGGDKAILAITFREPFDGEVFLRGVPEYDSAADAVRFAQLDFDLASRSFLLKTAATLLHGTIRESIERAAVLPLGRVLPSLAEREVRLAEGVSARVTVKRLRPLGVSLDDSALEAWVRAEGSATLSVGGK